MPEGSGIVWQAHRAGQDKYTYFLLAAAAAAIAFAVQKTEGATLTQDLTLLGLAVASWGISFYCGCASLNWVLAALRGNQAINDLKLGIHENQPDHPELTAAALSGVRKATESNAGKASKHAIWQFRFLIIGAVFFIAWHVTVLYLNTVTAQFPGEVAM